LNMESMNIIVCNEPSYKSCIRDVKHVSSKDSDYDYL